MSTFSLYPVMRRSFALAVFTGAGLAVAGAQAVSSQTNTPPAVQPFSFQTAAVPALFSTGAAAPFSSSSADDVDGYNPDKAANQQLASLEKNLGLPGAEAMQYGQRRRYGAPRYRGGNSNADGSEKYTGFAGGGLTLPTGDNANYLTTSWGLQVGAGRNFNRHLGLNLQFDWDKFGFTGQTLKNQSYLYFNDPTDTQYGLDGNSHIWSFTLNPTYQIYSGQGLGAYLVVGGGFYHKAASFFVPVAAEGYDPYYYGYYTYTANETVQNYSSNSAGVNGGIGLTYKFSRFANERFYAEVRAVHTFNEYRPGVTAADSTATLNSYTGWNYFPQNSLTTTYFPVKFGLRF